LISEYAQTDKQGVFTDCEFKVVEIRELPAITVSDSINILKGIFEDDNKSLTWNVFSKLLIPIYDI
jgi:hypothetical protein